MLWDLTRTGKLRWTLLGTSSEGQNHSRIVFNMNSFLTARRQAAAHQHVHGPSRESQHGGFTTFGHFLLNYLFIIRILSRDTIGTKILYFPDKMLGPGLSGLLLDSSHPGRVRLRPLLLPCGYRVFGAGGRGPDDPGVEHAERHRTGTTPGPSGTASSPRSQR